MTPPRQRVPARPTPRTRPEGLRGVVWALSLHRGELAPDGGILLCTAHWCLETGNGAKSMNDNPAGIKGKPSPEGPSDWTYYPTRERLRTPVAETWLRDPRVTASVREITPNGDDYTTVRVAPEHPACCFRAYDDLESGFVDYIALLERRFAKAWALLDPGATGLDFARALHQQGYFTANPDVYGHALERLMDELQPVLQAYHAGAEAPIEVGPDAATARLYARARAMLATTVLYGPDATTVAWGADA